jgi:hypothetical protein
MYLRKWIRFSYLCSANSSSNIVLDGIIMFGFKVTRSNINLALLVLINITKLITNSVCFVKIIIFELYSYSVKIHGFFLAFNLISMLVQLILRQL